MSADIGMVGPGHGKTDQAGSSEYRGHDGHIRQVGAPHIRIINHQQVARLPVPITDQIRHGVGHGPQMHRDMGRLGTQPALCIENGAGEIQAILDIGRQSAQTQYRAHLITDP